MLSALAGAFYQSNALRIYTPMRIMDPSSVLQQFGLAYLLFITATIISNLAIIGTVFSFLMNYQEKGPGNFTVNDVGRTLRQNIGSIIAIFLIILLLGIAIITLLCVLIFIAASAAPALGVLLAIFMMLGMFIVAPPILWQLSVVYLVAMKDNKGVFESLRKTRDVLRDNFWWTWLIVVCASIAIVILGFVFTLPQAAYQMFLMFSNMKGGGGETPIAFMILATVCTFCATLLQGVLHVINGVHYYSLAEKKDGTGLMDRINEIGNAPTANVHQQY